ncbi:MAG: PAS domain-containing protein [Nitrospiraceae bacterium]|nr:PAS domain-containing protein [Nitrospiraceae bacterium]
MHPAEKEQWLLKTLIETIPDMVWLKDPEGVYLVCNPAMMRFMGMTADQIIGKTDYDFFDRELAESLRGMDAAGRQEPHHWHDIPQ